ncbi:hypothetical protein BJV74DRAFT_444650 [Russula compacta]|nr:hypothetical protein BJV74DRAFT_444650 [Russula compacta]
MEWLYGGNPASTSLRDSLQPCASRKVGGMCEIQRLKRSAGYYYRDLISGKRATQGLYVALPPSTAQFDGRTRGQVGGVLLPPIILGCGHRISLLTIRVVRARALIEPPPCSMPTQHGPPGPNPCGWVVLFRLSGCRCLEMVNPLPLPLPCGGCETHMHTHTHNFLSLYLGGRSLSHQCIKIEPRSWRFASFDGDLAPEE